jgi:hypothetical protein
MFEIAAVIVCLLILCSVLLLLAVLLVVRAAKRIVGAAGKDVFGPADEHAWQRADALERERMVRKACGWRVLGRIVGAGVLVTGATVVASPTLAIMWCVAAWRVVKPIRKEMRDACAFKSTGAEDEPRQG